MDVVSVLIHLWLEMSSNLTAFLLPKSFISTISANSIQFKLPSSHKPLITDEANMKIGTRDRGVGKFCQ